MGTDQNSLPEPNAPIIVNAAGGREAATMGRLDLLPALAILRVGIVLDKGAATHGVDNWRRIPARSHLNHALEHAFALLADDTEDDHAGHFACRALMYLEQTIKEAENESDKNGRIRRD